MAQPKEAVKAAVKSPREEICLYCANRKHDICSPCSQEGKYRYLSPAELEAWESFEEVAFSRLVDFEPAARLAAIYLMAHYRL